MWAALVFTASCIGSFVITGAVILWIGRRQRAETDRVAAESAAYWTEQNRLDGLAARARWDVLVRQSERPGRDSGTWETTPRGTLRWVPGKDN